MSMTTSPGHTKFIIQDLKESYQIGKELYVMVHAKDFDNKSKRYGGDFFQAKLFWSKTKASVFGEVVDLLNGSYSVRFLLLWVGEAQVAVRLIHSSEAVQVLKHHRDTDSDRVFFNGYYEGPGPNKTRLSETVKCNVKWDKNGLEHMGTGDCCCEYNDPRTGETWRCQRPKLLPCNALVYHSMGGYRNRLTNTEKMFMKQTNKYINGDKRIIKILNSDGNEAIDVTEKCHPGLHTPVPAGFYLNDVWTSFVCSTRHFTTQTTTECLKDKHIYMMGDSTMRQWFEFFAKAVPTLKQMNLHVQYQSGPLMAVDVVNNIDLHWRAHGVPLRTRKTAVASLHYVSNEIDDLGGGPHTVIIFNLGPHFTTYPLDFFTHRVLRIRKAVLALLQRAPDTTVIIKTVNTGYKASVFGEVVDLLNGSYSVRFLLLWVGEAQVAVRLIHSSEAVQVLKHHRDTDSDRVFFNGYYEGPGPNKTRLSETVKCNVKWDKNGLEHMGTGDCCCEYNDPRTGETWRCQRPKSLPCNALVYHSMGGYRNRLTNTEKMFMTQTNKGINGDERIINIFHSDGNEAIDVTEKCHPGLHTPVPAGFYLNDVWTSFVCSTRHFTTQTTTECLKDKHIYMMGDSTMRQWFEFFAKAVPTLNQMNLHVQYQSGPLMAVDVENNIDLHWRAHGVPLRTRKTAVASLHYVSNEIDDLGGGPHTVIIFNLGPHFTTYPLDFFTHRVLRIRKAVLALLQRAPDTTVIIKTVNTGYKDIFGSDWYSLQLDRVLRWAFQDVGVYILDVWQMTACHYNKENIHPGPVIIKNEIDMLLSFICPN
ncbi:NXPE family member 3 [Anabarilius grahami]|uniref:NXPE family member 3 n=1 Tax=Anabarilius grahami TaxID=495550 RepID=A0A3N0XV24_ANAGA|nr:NXPE family member 3 [Anabarilius grahami]